MTSATVDYTALLSKCKAGESYDLDLNGPVEDLKSDLREAARETLGKQLKFKLLTDEHGREFLRFSVTHVPTPAPIVRPARSSVEAFYAEVEEAKPGDSYDIDLNPGESPEQIAYLLEEAAAQKLGRMLRFAYFKKDGQVTLRFTVTDIPVPRHSRHPRRYRRTFIRQDAPKEATPSA